MEFMLDLENFIPYSISSNRSEGGKEGKQEKPPYEKTTNLSNDEKIILIPLALNFPANRLRLTKSCCFSGRKV